MDSNTKDIIVAIAALGGLFLGLINIGITINKEYLRKPKLVVQLERASFVRRDEGIVDYQINVNLSSLHGDSYLNEIILVSDKIIDYEDGKFKKRLLKGHIGYIRDDLTALEEDKFVERVEPLYIGNNYKDVRNVVIKKDWGESFTFAGRLMGELHSDHSRSDIRSILWKLRIEHGNGVETIRLNPEWKNPIN